MPRRPTKRAGTDPLIRALVRPAVDALLRALGRLSGEQVAQLLLVVALLGAAAWIWQGGRRPPPAPPAAEGGYLACSWNVENFYDDRDDPDVHDTDEDWFGRNPDLVRQKVGRLAEALRMQGAGRGPDILALVEVESLRAAEMLRVALNGRLPADLHYPYVYFRENRTGRHFAPAVISRLPGQVDEALRFGATLRILPVRLEAGGARLTLLVSHWTSRLTDKTGDRRAVYGDALYRAARGLGGEADVLLCGDFNDEPDDPSVRDHLHAIADASVVRNADGPLRLLDLTAALDRDRSGTISYRGRRQVFDHVVASPGLLDPAGWLVLPGSLRVEDGPSLITGRDGRPWRFGGPNERGARGFSDHFAVSVRLQVDGGIGAIAVGDGPAP